jgi:hypothetical protein
MEVPPLSVTPYTKFKVAVAVYHKRVRHAAWSKHLLSLTLTDGTMIKLSSEAEILIAIRCLTSGAHAGKTPMEARNDEMLAARAVTTGVRE